MHNMIIEDERDVNARIRDQTEEPTPQIEMIVDENIKIQDSLLNIDKSRAQHRQIKNKDAHSTLQNVLIDHLWMNILISRNK